MRNLSKTDILASLTVGAGLLAIVGFAQAMPELGGSALAVGLILTVIMIRNVAVGINRDHTAILTALTDASHCFERVQGDVENLADKMDGLSKAQRKATRTAMAQADRIEQRAESMTRRILADLSFARLEVIDQRESRNE